MKTKLPVRDAVKDALVAFHYPEAARTKSAIELCRRLLERRLFDLDAIEQKISEETQESLPAPVSPELQPISASLDQIGAFEDNF